MSRFVQDFNGPSLIYPNGNEVFTSREITVQWIEPSDISTSQNLIWHEILFTEFYNDLKQVEWIQIANVPIDTTSFIWLVPEYIKSNKCRIGIRSINHKGEKSHISYSADNFSIQDKRLPIPAIFEPVEGSVYFSYVPIVLEKEGIIGQCSQRAFYQIYYSSESQEIDWTLMAGNIPVNSDPVYWDIRDLNTASDYSLKVELVDEDSVSEPVFVNNLQLNSLNYFLIDTKPPTGRIEILNNPEYTKEKNVVLQLSAYDETTEAKLFRVEQMDVSSKVITEGPYQNLSDLSTWYISGADGVKLIQVRFKDYAGNVLPNASQKEFFRIYKFLDNTEITSFVVNKDGEIIDIWIAFGGDSPQLYLNQNLASSLSGEASSMIIYNDVLYIAIRNEENKAILQRYSGGKIKTVRNLDTVDSAINCMEVFDDKLFMGLDNGNLFSFDGGLITEEYADDIYKRSIYHLETNKNALFIFFDSTSNILVLTKNKAGEYSFATLTTEV